MTEGKETCSNTPDMQGVGMRTAPNKKVHGKARTCASSKRIDRVDRERTAYRGAWGASPPVEVLQQEAMAR
jgi:hypothetical protein